MIRSLAAAVEPPPNRMLNAGGEVSQPEEPDAGDRSGSRVRRPEPLPTPSTRSPRLRARTRSARARAPCVRRRWRRKRGQGGPIRGVQAGADEQPVLAELQCTTRRHPRRDGSWRRPSLYGDLSRENRVSRPGRATLPSPNSSCTSASSDSNGPRTASSYTARCAWNQARVLFASRSRNQSSAAGGHPLNGGSDGLTVVRRTRPGHVVEPAGDLEQPQVRQVGTDHLHTDRQPVRGRTGGQGDDREEHRADGAAPRDRRGVGHRPAVDVELLFDHLALDVVRERSRRHHRRQHHVVALEQRGPRRRWTGRSWFKRLPTGSDTPAPGRLRSSDRPPAASRAR